MLAPVAANGTTTGTNYTLDPGNTNCAGLYVSQSTLALRNPVLNTAQNLSGTVLMITPSLRAYSTGSRERFLDATFPGGASAAALANIRSVGLAVGSSGSVLQTASVNSAFRILLDAAQTKNAYYELKLSFRYSWGRVLIN